jgi:hypothetical protein
MVSPFLDFIRVFVAGASSRRLFSNSTILVRLNQNIHAPDNTVKTIHTISVLFAEKRITRQRKSGPGITL